MSLKIFMPVEYFYRKQHCNLYGQVQISEDNVVAYYIVDDCNSLDTKPSCKMRFLGSIINSEPNPNWYCERDMIICFTYNEKTSNISLAYIGIKPESLKQIKLFLYDKASIKHLVMKDSSKSFNLENNECDFLMLFRLIQSDAADAKLIPFFGQSMFLLANMPMYFFVYVVERTFIHNIMKHTIIYKHSILWQTTFKEGSKMANIVLDRILGLILMLALFTLVSHPGDFLINISHGIIQKLYSLLRVLEGSPIGLKLNSHLNNFFLDCFKYHIELWSTFLDLIEPIVRQLFIAIGLVGCLGFTYQLALLADLISIVGLHAHCFYVYTKVLYNVEMKGLKVLWQVVRGKRYNVLKDRTEAHNYMNRQLYLAAIIFSAILFLLPTILVYYAVFGTVKSLTFVTFTILEFFQRQLLSFPIDMCLKWLNKSVSVIECFKVRDLPLQQQLLLKHSDISVYVFKIEI